MASPDTKTGCVYALVDPRDESIHYVGLAKPSRPGAPEMLVTRGLSGNLRSALGEWIRSVDDAGPRIIRLGDPIPADALPDHHAAWVEECERRGAPLKVTMTRKTRPDAPASDEARAAVANFLASAADGCAGVVGVSSTYTPPSKPKRVWETKPKPKPKADVGRDEEQTGYVFVLADPDTKRPRYVAATTETVASAVGVLVTVAERAHGTTAISNWLKTLDGREPIAVSLSGPLPAADLDSYRKAWAIELSIRGADLLQKVPAVATDQKAHAEVVRTIRDLDSQARGAA